MAPRRPPLILLPPSETKSAVARGRPIDLESLSFPALTPLRDAVLDADLREAPTTTAGRLYRGVLYSALDIATLPARTASNLVIISAQFGALRPGDRVPAYRREMDAAPALDPALPPSLLPPSRNSSRASSRHPTAQVGRSR